MKEELPVELRDVAEALVGAWRARPAQEQVRLAQQLRDPRGTAKSDRQMVTAAGSAQSSDVSAPPDPELVERVVVAAERIAAISGAVVPSKLVGNDVLDAVASLVLDQLAGSFDRSFNNGNWSWRLKSDRRELVLRTLKGDELASTLAKAEGVETDAIGIELRRLLSDGPFRSNATLDVQAVAAEWATAIKPSLAGYAAERRLEAARQRLRQALDRLLQEGFFGRTSEIRRLHAFARQHNNAIDIPIQPVSGIGGSGKSTLLAKALRPLLEEAFQDPTAPMIVSLDFDRRHLLAGGELELSYELSRQLALYFPEVDAELSQLRDESSRSRIRRGELSRSQSEFESASRSVDEFDHRVAFVLQKAGTHRRQLVIVLDTFEEWQREQYKPGLQSAGMRRLLDWLVNLRFTWELQIKVILSGRAAPPRGSLYAASDSPFAIGGPPPTDVRSIFERAIVLRELRPSEARRMLLGLGVRPASAAAILERVAGGLPLSLKLAARHYLQVDSEDREKFLGETEQAVRGLSTELRQGVLYHRFLEHIPDEGVRKVAHPGLALRRVSPLLIKEVLAVPCQLGPLTIVQAEQLYMTLAREVWLVEDRGEYLIHRPELRKVMLKAMQRDESYAHRVREVHNAAAAWYSQSRISTRVEMGEAIYHRLITAEPYQIDGLLEGVDRDILLDVVESADDFDDEVRARLLYRAGRKVSMADAHYLPQQERLRWADTTGASAVRSGEPKQALSIWRDFGEGARNPPEWLATALFQAGAWSDIGELRRAEAFRGSLRYPYLMSFVAERFDARGAHQLRMQLHELVRHAARAERRSRMAYAPADLIDDYYFSSILGIEASTDLLSRSALLSVSRDPQLDSTRYMRLRWLLGEPPAVSLDNRSAYRLLAGAFRPAPHFLRTVTSHVERHSSSMGRATRSFWQSIEERIPKLKTSEILGDWSEQFANAVLSDLASTYESHQLVGEVLAGFASDDPEWRTPIRIALASSLSDPERATFAITKILQSWTPEDLHPDRFLTSVKRNPRKAWLGTVEYLDRAGALADFMSAMHGDNSIDLHQVSEAYLLWQSLRERSNDRD